jgi:hypothetical protein
MLLASASSVLSNSLGASMISGLKQPFDSVILGLLHPFALRAERADIWGVGYVRGSDNRK